MNPDVEVTELDLSTCSVAELRSRLLSAGAGSHIALSNSTGKSHGIAAGVATDVRLEIRGDVGDFLYFAGRAANITVAGSCGHGCGYSMASGSVLIRGSAGDFLAAYAGDGFVAVHGTAGHYCGYALEGADVVVRGRCGDRAGCGMTAGDLVLCKGAGRETGLHMKGGTIFIRGSAEIAENIRKVRMKSTDQVRLSLLLARAGIKGDAKEFQAYRLRTHS